MQKADLVSNLYLKDGRPFIDLLETSNKDGTTTASTIDQGSHSSLFILKDKSSKEEKLVAKVTNLQQEGQSKQSVIINETRVVDLILKDIESKKKLGSGIQLTNVVIPHASTQLYSDKKAKTVAGHYFTFEYLSGQLVKLKYNKMLSDANCVNIIYQVASGLANLVALNSKFVHRDISLNNIMFSENKNSYLIFKLIDFGTSIIESTRTKENSGQTTANINAPEILNPSHPYKISGNKEDIYSLGMCLYQLLSQKLKKYGILGVTQPIVILWTAL